LAPLDAFDSEAVAAVSDSRILKGIDLSLLPALLTSSSPMPSFSHPPSSLPSSFAAALALRPYCATTLRYAADRSSSPSSSSLFHVLSVSWSSFLITAATGLSPARVTCNHLVEEVGSDGRLLTTGAIEVKVGGPGGKLGHFQRLLQVAEAGPEGGGQKGRGRSSPSVFIGDSVTDVLALMAADVGIVVGESRTLRRMLRRFGWKIRGLVAFPVKKEERGKASRVVYAAEDWAEIAAFLYGKDLVKKMVEEGRRYKGNNSCGE
jgi:hypothetical protein